MKNNIAKHLPSVTSQLLGLLMIVIMACLITGVAQAADPDGVSFTLEGCKASGPGYVVGSYDPDAGDLICNDGAYTTGNLGKSWNELDLVPHRITTDAGNSAPDTQTYTFNATQDYEDTGALGYDVMSEPILDVAKSDASCVVVVGPQTILDPGVGGTDKSLSRSLTVTQDKNTICVFDYVERLALGAHLYPGSSLHSNLLNENLETGGIGNKDVSIPVNEILPQELAKDMSASQDQEISWNITKEAAPADLDFGDSCLIDPPADQDVNLTIKWYVQTITPGMIMVTTNVYATNPSLRTVVVNVTDEIFGDTGGGEVLLDTLSSGDVDVLPGEDQLVLTHTFDAPVGTTGLRDVATATYKDKIFPDQTIPGETTAEASVDTIGSGMTLSADVNMTDTEILSGTDFSYVVSNVSSTIGNGDPLGGSWQGGDPASGIWTSAITNYLDCPDAGNPCEAVFTKTVSVLGPPVIADEELSDTAQLDSTDGVFNTEVSKTVDLSVDATVSLTIEKTIPDVLQGDETASFTFNVCPAPDGTACTGSDVASVTFDFTAGETSKSDIVSGLPPGEYLVYEAPPGPGWGTVPDQWINLTLPTCSGTTSFNNDLAAGGAEAAVAKVTVPDGSTSWEMTLSGTTLAGDPVSETITVTANTGFALFGTVLEEGAYTVSETGQTGWDLTNVGGDGCDFSVDLPDDDGRIFECTFTNVQAQIDLTKICDDLSKVGDDVDYTITLNNTTGVGAQDLTCTITDALLGIDTTVTVASGASHVIDTSRTVLDGDPNPLVNNVSASCSFGEGASEAASAEASCDTELFDPSFSVTKTGDAQGKVGDDVDYTITLTNSSSANTPALTCTATDTLLGTVFGPAVLSAGDTVINKSRTVLAGDPNPLGNTVTLSCSLPDGFTNVLEDAQDSHSVDLFDPSFSVTKTGDAQGKVGDDVDYTITLTNSSSANTPALTCTATDTLLGTVFGPAVLSAGDTVINKSRTVLAGDPNPLGNTVTLSCSLPDGFTNVLEDAQDSHSVDLFDPSFSVTKTGDAQGKVGDDVDYTITLTNSSSANTPALTCTATDTLLGTVFGPAVLSAGDTVINKSRTVLAGDPNPLGNTVTLSCSLPDGFTNVLEDAQDSHSVDLFDPSFSVTKTGDAQGKVGDDVDYTITLTNSSSANTPALTCTATDTLLGTVFGPAVLSAGDTVINKSRTVLAGDPNPLGNTVTLSCSLPDGFTNVLEDAQDSHSVDLFDPSFSVTKTGDAQGKVGDDVDYTITLTNSSSANTPALTCTATDTLLGTVFGPAVLSAGDTVINKSRTVLAGDPNPLGNTVTLSCSLPDGFTNVLEDAQDSHSVDLFDPSFSVTKTGDAQGKVGDDVDYTITLTNSSSANTPALTCTATDTLLGTVFGPAVLSAGDTVINKSRTVLAGDPNPLGNTVTLSCSLPDGFTNVLEDAQDSHSVDLFDPSFSVTKTGDAQGKVGDDVDYTITLTNSSSANTPALTCTATDTLLGTVFGPAVLSAGDTVINKSRTVLAGDPNPLGNTVTLSCSLPDGFTNVLEDAQDSHSVDLFDPSFSVTKTGDAQGKVGDDVDYTITLTNSSSANTPALTCTATDTLLGTVFGPAVLSAGDTVINKSRTVLAGDPNPLGNTVTLSCSLPDGFTNVLEDAQDSHSVDLFGPAFSVTKTGDETSKVGDVVDYTITLTNSSSANTPALTCTATDTLLGGVIFGPAVLPPGNTVINKSRTVLVGDPNPLVNNVTLSCRLPAGFTNVLTNAMDSHSVDLVDPSFTVAKTCTNEPVPQAGPATWDIVVKNTGNVLLDVVLNDSVQGIINVDDLGVGEARTIPISLAGPFSGLATVSNSVSATATLAIDGDYTNTIQPADAEDTCYVAGEVNLTKLTQGVLNDEGEIIPSPGLQNWTFTLYGPGLPASGVTDTSPPSEVDFGGVDLTPIEFDGAAVYRLCEGPINAGWTLAWYGDPNDTGAADMLIPFLPMNSNAPVPDPKENPPGYSNVFDPNYVDPPATFINDTRCVNFVANAGETEVFKIDNQFPGGEPRTIGYWKNWNSCTSGGQVNNAAEAGDTSQERIDAAKALLDDALQDPGMTIGLLNLIADDDIYNCDIGTQWAVNILDKRTRDGRKKRSSDAAYGLASQLIAAIANVTVGAGSCPARDTAVSEAQILLTSISFDGTGEYLTPKKVKNSAALQDLRMDANSLAGTLDSYNNGTLCVAP